MGKDSNENEEQRVPEMSTEGPRLADSGEATPPTSKRSPQQQILKRDQHQLAVSENEASPQDTKRAKNSQSPDSTEDSPPLPILPHEIVIEIVSRLPVKSLIRFRCVCKSWKALISDPHFVKNHLTKTTMDPKFTHRRIIMSSTAPQFSLKSCSLYSIYNKPDGDTIELDYPSKNKYRCDWIVGSCDGLVCVAIGQGTVYLWNPSVRETKRLPKSGFKKRAGSYAVYGFGYDCSIDDYKVVGMFCFRSEGVNGLGYETQVKIYSLRTNSWRRIQDFARYIPSDESGKYVSGTLNWLMVPKGDLDLPTIIVSLDLAKETYQEVSQPLYGEGNYEIMFGVLGGCLCILCNYGGARADVWVMKEHGVRESWTKSVTIPYLPDPWSLWHSPPLFISMDGEILLVCDSRIMLYNSKDNTSRYPVIHGARACFETEIYIESLVSPNAEN